MHTAHTQRAVTVSSSVCWAYWYVRTCMLARVCVCMCVYLFVYLRLCVDKKKHKTQREREHKRRQAHIRGYAQLLTHIQCAHVCVREQSGPKEAT